MRILVALPVKADKDPMLTLGTLYLTKLRTPFSGQALFLNPKNGAEGNQKLLHSTLSYTRIALTEEGTRLSSSEFAKFLADLSLRSSKAAFIIGCAFGLSKEVKESSDYRLSLSAMTLPHRLAFLVACEQIYRAHEILRGSPYHK